MNINLYTDAPKHNLALMQISTWHKAQGEKQFKRFIDTFMWRKYKTVQEAWRAYA